MTRYIEPSWFTRHVFNRFIRRLTRIGVGAWGARELRVRGRTSGHWRTTVVNLNEVDGRRYLVAPRGTTEWVRNLRAAGRGELRVGRRAEPFVATELADADKPEVLGAYLRRWKWEISQFFQGVGPDAPRSELARIAPDYPVFLIEAAS